jgi:hypothetical protein
VAADRPKEQISGGLETKAEKARCWWLMPIILATQEAEIRKIEFQSQPGQIVHETLSRKNPSQKRAGGVAQGVGLEFKPQYCQKKSQGESTQTGR